MDKYDFIAGLVGWTIGAALYVFINESAESGVWFGGAVMWSYSYYKFGIRKPAK